MPSAAILPDPQTPSNDLVRITRILAMTVLLSTLVVICINFTIAWVFTSGLTNPGCHPPTLIVAFPKPEEHWLLTEDGVSIRTWYYPSQNGAAILVFGGPVGALGTRSPPVMPLLREGYGILQIDSRACADPPAPVTLGMDETMDAAAGLAFLHDREEIIPIRIGAYGFSMGGVTAIRAAAQMDGLRAIIPEGGYYNLGGHILKSTPNQPLAEAVLRQMITWVYTWRTGLDPWDSSPIDDLPAISPRPVFLIYGENEIENGGGWEQYQAAQQPKTIWIVPGGSHGRNHQAAPLEYERRVVEFFDRYLLDQY
jgi:dipeptidyl aminopeptidase/acylaminoacyl peptidase